MATRKKKVMTPVLPALTQEELLRLRLASAEKNLALQEARAVVLERQAYVAKIDPTGRLLAMDSRAQELHRHASTCDEQYKGLIAKVSKRVGFDIGAGCTIDTETGTIIQHEKKE
jgi:hypothetical protein